MQSLLTPEVHAAIVESIRGGNYVETAAQAARVGKTTFYDWMKRGEADDASEPYLSFAADVRAAEAEAEHDAVETLKRASIDDWKAAEVYLKRRFPTKWGDKVEQTIDATIHAAILIPPESDE